MAVAVAPMVTAICTVWVPMVSPATPRPAAGPVKVAVQLAAIPAASSARPITVRRR